MTVHMTGNSFILALGTGSALIAFWLCLRFPDRAPENFKKALIHVAVALGAGWVAPSITSVLFPQGFAGSMTAFFVVLFPVLVYTFLSGAWFLRLAQERIGHHR
jgi:hypothetical protein